VSVDSQKSDELFELSGESLGRQQVNKVLEACKKENMERMGLLVTDDSIKPSYNTLSNYQALSAAMDKDTLLRTIPVG
jgi:hypothetical protein